MSSALPNTYKNTAPILYMTGQGDDAFVLRDWVRKQLETGDDPEVLKAVLKNRGLDPNIVDNVLVLLSFSKKPVLNESPEEKKEPQKKFYNHALKREVDLILASPENTILPHYQESPLEEKQQPSDIVKENVPENFQEAVAEEPENNIPVKPDGVSGKSEESLLSLFRKRVSDAISRIHIRTPGLPSFIMGGNIVILLGIIVAVLIVAYLFSFGMNWYADRMARAVLQ